MMNRAVFALAILVAACHSSDAFYRTLNDVPQAYPLVNTSYAVGDTLRLSGKLGGPHGDLQVRIGGVTAPIVSHTDSTNGAGADFPGTSQNRTIDYVAVIIAQAMGLGAGRMVTVTVGGVERDVGLITITPTRLIPARTDTLIFTDTIGTYLPHVVGGNAMVARGDNGDGRVYAFAGDTLAAWQNGARTILLTAVADQYGAFHIIGDAGAANTFMAVDETGRYLYASVITDSAATDTTVAFRLIKVDLQSLTIRTLNRTIFPQNQADVTPAYAASLTLTGLVGAVFLPPLTQLFPGADGSIYFVADGVQYANFGFGPPATVYLDFNNLTQGYFSSVGKIDPAGTVSYLVKTAGYGLPILTTAGAVDLLPGVVATPPTPWSWIDCIDPDNGTVYASTNGRNPSGTPVPAPYAKVAYDLQRHRVLATFNPGPPPDGFSPGGFESGIAANTNGPFSVVDGMSQILGTIRGGGHRVWAEIKDAGVGAYGSIKILDFDKRTVTPYAWTSDFPRQTWVYSPNNGTYGWLDLANTLVNHTPRGDPVLVEQQPFTFEGSAGFYRSLVLAPRPTKQP